MNGEADNSRFVNMHVHVHVYMHLAFKELNRHLADAILQFNKHIPQSAALSIPNLSAHMPSHKKLSDLMEKYSSALFLNRAHWQIGLGYYQLHLHMLLPGCLLLHPSVRAYTSSPMNPTQFNYEVSLPSLSHQAFPSSTSHQDLPSGPSSSPHQPSYSGPSSSSTSHQPLLQVLPPNSKLLLQDFQPSGSNASLRVALHI